MKRCPFCAEEIQDEAVKCRFCGEYLKKKSKWKNCLIGCLIASVVLILGFIAFVYISLLIMKLVFQKIFSGMPPYYSPPFTGGGIEGIMRDFLDTFRALWERLKDFFIPGQRVTF